MNFSIIMVHTFILFCLSSNCNSLSLYKFDFFCRLSVYSYLVSEQLIVPFSPYHHSSPLCLYKIPLSHFFLNYVMISLFICRLSYCIICMVFAACLLYHLVYLPLDALNRLGLY